VLYLALLLWHRPFERQLHNIVQAVRASSFSDARACAFACTPNKLTRVCSLSFQASLLMTWLCLLVGESLFNTAATTGAISLKRQVRALRWLNHDITQKHPGSHMHPRAERHRHLAGHRASHRCGPAATCGLSDDVLLA
jgi:hypothetical protein